MWMELLTMSHGSLMIKDRFIRSKTIVGFSRVMMPKHSLLIATMTLGRLRSQMTYLMFFPQAHGFDEATPKLISSPLDQTGNGLPGKVMTNSAVK
jgi:hypothetical protein